MKEYQELIEQINTLQKKLNKEEEKNHILCKYLAQKEIFPPDMTNDEKAYFIERYDKPQWSKFLQVWSQFFNNTWQDYKDAINNA